LSVKENTAINFRSVARRFADRKNVRLAVTGLTRSGKTVFTTSFIHNLLSAGLWPERLPFLAAASRGDIIAGEVFSVAPGLRDTPRFPYEESLGAITGKSSTWPRATDRLSAIRLAMRYRTRRKLARARGSKVQILNVDLVDYPGEWLLDLPLAAKSFAKWSEETLGLAKFEPRAGLAKDWLAHMAKMDGPGRAKDADMEQAADLYKAYLEACRAPDVGMVLGQPARFIRPGDLDPDDPILQFCPLELLPAKAPAGSVYQVMEERYNAYRDLIVRPFYRDHFRGFDEQIVLVDVLSALRLGKAAFDDAQAAIGAILQSFDYGKSGLLSWLTGVRISKVLFAATKSDHVSSNQHHNLKRLLEEMVAREANRIRFRGVQTGAVALSAVRCTEDVLGEVQGQTLSMVRGLPAGRDEETALFPGEIPAHFPTDQDWHDGRFKFLDFIPARISWSARGLPHVGMDEAMEYLIGKRLK
jgi:predicted YcjX-like family ATPase